MQRSDRPALQQQPVAADQVSEVEANIISYGAKGSGGDKEDRERKRETADGRTRTPRWRKEI